MNKIIFVILADREVNFYFNIAKILNKKKIFTIEFLSFYEPKNHLLKSFKVINFYNYLNKTDKKYNYNKDSLFHEKVTFNLSNSINLEDKMNNYIHTLINIYKDYKEKLFFFHELGGWIAPQSVLNFCIIKNHKNIFFEPSFFKGKIDYLINSNFFKKRKLRNINKIDINKTNSQITNYHKNFLKKFNYIIPDKDKHNLKSIYFFKLFNLGNLKIILYKFFQKNILNKNFEYSHYFAYSFRYFRMLVNKKKLNSIYTKDISFNKKFKYIFFPIHFSLDFSITIRANKYFDQLKLLNSIIKIMPKNSFLLIKEHPVSAGLINYKEIKDFLNKNKNVILIDPYINIHQFLSKIDLLVTINSKAGFEAILDNINSVCLKDSFYKEYLQSLKLNYLSKKNLNYLLNKKINYIEIKHFINSYINNLMSGELYNLNTKNLRIFASSLHKLINELT